MAQTINVIDEATSENTNHDSRRAVYINNDHISLIVEKLKVINPYKIILFGSYAYGEPNADSDIDLIVILNKKGVAKTYKEKSQNRMLVGKQLLDIEREVALDTLVYSIDEWALFLNQNSYFSKLVNGTGIVLYEADNPRVA